MNKVIIAFCEGQHDIAFLTKVLLINGFVSYDKKIKDFLIPLNKLFEMELNQKKIADKKLGFQSDYIIPSVALKKEESTLVLFHNLNGDERESERKKILEMYKNLQSADDDFSDFNLNFRFLFFFDADELGIEQRIRQLNEELRFSNMENIVHNEIMKFDSYEWGCHIFHNNENKGDLEDILLELMTINNEDIFRESISFISSNKLEEERQKEFKCNFNSEDYRGKSKFKEKKSIISVAGQLQFSGMNNSVIISKSDYIKINDILENVQCQNIYKLFE